MVQIFALLLICGSTVNSGLISSSLNILGGCFNDFNTYPKGDELVESPGFSEGKNYKPGSYCKWFIKSPNNTQIELNCEVEIPKGADCSTDGLVVSTSGDLSFKDGLTRCGKTSFTILSEYNKLGVELKSDKSSVGGKFSCKLREVGAKRTRAVYSKDCDCGWSNQYRIVNGYPTGVNQYIFMAGIIDYSQRYIMCGGTLISKKHVLTAAHCLRSLSPATTAVTLGEYDTSTNYETSATIVVRVKGFKSYPFYDFGTKKYDLALIELATEINFNSRIGPACLPINSATWNLVGQVVTIMGWGTTEYGGKRSSVLLQTNQLIVDIQECVNSLEGDIEATTQYCTSGQDTDACQNDSGGPVIWINPDTNRYEIIGIISYGRGCALGYPSVNTRVAPFLQWIFDNTQGDDYCALDSNQ